jgi:putative oxidoreductase
MQRLFSTFPSGWPGLGLLLLRLIVGIALVCLVAIGLFGPDGDRVTIAPDLVAAAGGILLIAGLWTPATGAVIALNELWIAFSVYFSHLDGHWTHIFLAVLTAAVAMLGPGAYSIDARLFGRKRFDFDRTRDGKRFHWKSDRSSFRSHADTNSPRPSEK